MKHKSFKFKTTNYKRAVFFCTFAVSAKVKLVFNCFKSQAVSEKVKLALRPIYDDVSKKFEL